MKGYAPAIWVEMFKARRSKMPLLTGAGFLLLPLMGGFFMIVLKDPVFPRQVGLISTKAQLTAGVADWPSYIDLLAQGVAIGGLILFSLIGSWIFGREFSDRTVKDLLALPTSRSAIVSAKFIIMILWSAVLVALVCLAGLVIGFLVTLPQTSPLIIWQGGLTLAITAGLTIATVTPIVFFASAGHGYLPPVGVAILTIFLAQIMAIAGWGEYFPWSIPALYSQGAELEPISYVIVFLTGIIGIAATFIWWQRVDQTS